MTYWNTMRLWAGALFFCLFCGTLSAAPSKGSKQSDAQPAAAEGPNNSALAPLIDQPLRLADFTGMEPSAELRARLGHVSGFFQSQPSDGQPATEQTEVWIAHTRSTLYLVFICHDSHPNLIRGNLALRENIFNDDNVSVLLDTFPDRRTGTTFRVNPMGVQADAAHSENNGNDWSYDTVWDSEGRVTPTGWMALVAIPFRSLRFRSNHSEWGIVFTRNLPRNSEQDHWPYITSRIAGTLSQEGTLGGIEGVSGSRNFQLNPYTLGQNERSLNIIDATNPFISSRHVESTAGGEAKLILKDSIVVDATINPDFSDVESEAPQFTVNQRYPVYFPELRPFFLENASYFNTPATLVYTRNIVRPEYGLRVTGKINSTNLGLLVSDDRQPGQAYAPGDPLYGKRALVAVGRLSRDIGKDSSVGAIYTDYEFGSGWNRIGGVDFTARLGEHWTARGLFAASSTMGDRDSGTPPPYYAGPAGTLQLQRSGHSFNLQSEYNDVSTGFETLLGFLQSSNLRSSHTHFNYQWYPKNKFYQSWGLEGNQDFAFDHSGNRVYRYTTFDPFWMLPRKIVFATIVGQNSDTVLPDNYSALAATRNFTENFSGIVFRGSPWSLLDFDMQAIRSGNVNYNPAAGKPPAQLKQEQINLRFTVRPISRLTIDNTYLLDRDHSSATGAFVYEAQTMRSKVNYQFTRSLSARVIAEWDTTHANPAETTIQRTRQFASQALLTWLPHPGTAIYIGYSNDLANLDRSLCNRLSSGLCDPNNTTPPRAGPMMNDGRQIFIKASYLFRF